MIRKTKLTKIGLNVLSNRSAILNGKINLQDLNNQFNDFKVKMKKLFINWIIMRVQNSLHSFISRSNCSFSSNVWVSDSHTHHCTTYYLSVNQVPNTSSSPFQLPTYMKYLELCHLSFPVNFVISFSCCLFPFHVLPLSHSLLLLSIANNNKKYFTSTLCFLISLYQGCYSSWPYRFTT